MQLTYLREQISINNDIKKAKITNTFSLWPSVIKKQHHSLVLQHFHQNLRTVKINKNKNNKKKNRSKEILKDIQHRLISNKAG